MDGTDFGIFEFTITNNSNGPVPVWVGLAGDFDLDESGGDDTNGKDLSLPLVFEYDATDDTISGFYYAAGIALAGETPFDNYRLGACCDVSFESSTNDNGPALLDIQRLHYFNARPNEECDDGGTGNGDGCSANCLNESGDEVCGNGVVEPGEGCDDGDTDGGDGCDANCRSELCGNGSLDPGEECDDGNTDEADGCSSFCTSEYNKADGGHYCGDAKKNNGGVGDQVTTEQDSEVTISADLGTLNPGESATAAFCIVGGISTVGGLDAGQKVIANSEDCLDLYQQTIAVCGNGIQNAGEQCDDGNTTDDDGCDSNCTLSGCGNGIVNQNETCDDGNQVSGDGCSSTCATEAADPDDLNTSNGGCQIRPQVNSGGNFDWIILFAPFLLITFWGRFLGNR